MLLQLLHWKAWKFVLHLPVRQNKESVHNVMAETLLPIKWFSAVKLLGLWQHNLLVNREPSLHCVHSTWEVLRVTFPKKINYRLNLTGKPRSKILKPLKAKITKEELWISLFPVLLKLNLLTRKQELHLVPTTFHTVPHCM